MSQPFRLLLRVRYGECDAQGIVFNARWGDYADIASSEFTRALFGDVRPEVTGLDWKLVRQTIEWHGPARYDDVLELRVRTLRIGTTSFTLATEVSRHPEQEHLASIETTCVMIDPASGDKKPITPEARAALDRGAPGALVDQAGAPRRS